MTSQVRFAYESLWEMPELGFVVPTPFSGSVKKDHQGSGPSGLGPERAVQSVGEKLVFSVNLEGNFMPLESTPRPVVLRPITCNIPGQHQSDGEKDALATDGANCFDREFQHGNHPSGRSGDRINLGRTRHSLPVCVDAEPAGDVVAPSARDWLGQRVRCRRSPTVGRKDDPIGQPTCPASRYSTPGTTQPRK